jgi:hypothetical protein
LLCPRRSSTGNWSRWFTSALLRRRSDGRLAERILDAEPVFHCGEPVGIGRQRTATDRGVRLAMVVTVIDLASASQAWPPRKNGVSSKACPASER